MFSSASIKKGKRTQIQTYNQEQTRVMGDGQEKWQNPNIDTTKTHAIEVVFNEHGGDVEAAIYGRIEEAGVKRKVRDNAVTHLTVYASMPDYSARSEDERRQFEEAVKRFLERRYGEGNVVDMRWHFDETSPHLHATVVPITKDGRLCAKELFKPTKKSMEQWQRDYYAEVSEPLGYARPDFGHSAEKNYTKETIATRAQLECVRGQKAAVEAETEEAQVGLESVQGQKRAAEEKGQKLESRAEQGRDSAAAARARTRDLENAVERERARNRELAERTRNLATEVGELREHVSRLEAAVRSLAAALARVPGVLDMAVHKMRDGFRKAMESFEAGMRAMELEREMGDEYGEPEEEQGLDNLLNNYSEQEDYGYGDLGDSRAYGDYDL